MIAVLNLSKRPSKSETYGQSFETMARTEVTNILNVFIFVIYSHLKEYAEETCENFLVVVIIHSQGINSLK